MKKLIFVLCIVTVIMSFGIVAGAENFNNKEWGMNFEIPEGFSLISVNNTKTEGYLSFMTDDSRACVNLNFEHNAAAYFENAIFEEEFIYNLDKACSTEYLTELMTHGVVSFKSKEVYSKTLGETKYYFFNGKYVWVGKDIDSENLSVTAVTWAKNGKVYVMSYICFEGGQSFDAESFLTNVDFSSGEIKVYVNDKRVYSDTSPAAVNGRTLVPIRAVAEAMGYDVNWNGEEMLVTLIPGADGGNKIEFEIDSASYLINEEEHTLDVPAVAINGRTYIPLRAAAEAMGAKVTWDDSSNSAMIMH